MFQKFLCEQTFDDVRDLAKHLSSAHDEEPYACGKCDVT